MVFPMSRAFSLIVLMLLFLPSCLTVSKKAKSTEPDGMRYLIGQKKFEDDTIAGYWSLYSWGLMHKSLALEEQDRAKRSEQLGKAVKYFQEAAKYGKFLDEIYYQISDCYYYSLDFGLSMEYANKSIQLNNKNFKSYNRIFYNHIRLRENEKAAKIVEDYLKLFPGAGIDMVYVKYLLADHYYKRLKNFDRAAELYNDILTISEKYPVDSYYVENANYYLGYIYYIKGDFSGSETCYRKILEFNPENFSVVFMLAMACMAKYDLDEARKYALLFLGKYPGDMNMHLILGRILYVRNEAGALTHLSEALGLKTIDGLLATGLRYEILQNDEKAENMMRTVIRYSPRLIDPHLALARIDLRKDDKEAAFNEYLTAGILFYNNKMFTEAYSCFTEAMKLNDSVAGLYYYLGRTCEDMNKISLAIIYYKKAVELKPDAAMILHLGYLYGVRKDYDESIKLIDRASDMEPGNSRPYFFKGLISLWKEDYPVAEISIKKAILLHDKDENYHFYLAVVLEKMKKINEAILSLENAIRQNPKSARSYNYLGYLYADNNREIDRSFMLIQKALEMEPNNGAYIDSLGWVYYRKGEYRLALEKLLMAEKILRESNSSDPAVYDHIGDAYEKLGKVSKALKYWKLSVELEKSPKVQEKIDQHRKK